MDINNTILSFGDYFLLTLKTGGKKIIPLLLTLIISFAAMIILFIICLIPIGLALANNLSLDILQDQYALAYYLYSGELFYELAPALPLICCSFVFVAFFASVVGCFQNAMVYIIADSSASDEKRSFGKMFAFAIKRTFPTLGTTVVLSLIYIGIFAVFALAVIAISSGMRIDISSIIYYDDISSQMQLAMYSILMLVLYLIMLCFMVFISIIYSMSVFARAKYKFSGIASLRYARKLTKGKRGKILGNILLFALIYIVIGVLLSFASTSASDYGIPFVPFLLQLIIGFIGMLVSVFWAIMFINFDNVKGQDIINDQFTGARNIKDIYFENGAEAQSHTYNQNYSQQANAPIQNPQTDAYNAPTQSSGQTDMQPTDVQTDNSLNSNLQDINQHSEEQIKTNDKDTAE